MAGHNERQLLPVSQTQRLNIRARRLGHAKQVNNIATCLLVEEPLALDVLRQAAEQAIERNDSFAIRIVRHGAESRQYFGERRALVLDTVDFTGRTQEEMDRFCEKVARTPLPLYDKPQAKIYVVRAPDGACGLFTCISHLIMDTWAITLFYRDVLQIYRALTTGGPMPPAVEPFEEMLRKEIEYIGSPRQARDREFWQNELERFGTPPAYSAIDGTRSRDRYRTLIRKPDHPFGHVIMVRSAARHESLPIPASDVESFIRFCTANRVSLQTLLLLGLRTYLARVNGRVDDVSITVTVARRGTLREKRAGGDRATGMILRTVIPPEATFAEALQEMEDTQNAHNRHADFHFMDYLKMHQATYGMKPWEWYAMVSFTMIAFDMDTDLPVRFRGYATGTSPMPVYVIVSRGQDPGSLSILYEYQYKRVSLTSVRLCHAYTLDVIRAGIADPSITMGELLELPRPAITTS